MSRLAGQSGGCFTRHAEVPGGVEAGDNSAGYLAYPSRTSLAMIATLRAAMLPGENPVGTPATARSAHSLEGHRRDLLTARSRGAAAWIANRSVVCRRLAVAIFWLVVLFVGKAFLHGRVGLLEPGVHEFFCEFTTGIEAHSN
jgi:hypothetical protein